MKINSCEIPQIQFLVIAVSVSSYVSIACISLFVNYLLS